MSLITYTKDIQLKFRRETNNTFRNDAEKLLAEVALNKALTFAMQRELTRREEELALKIK